MINRIKTIQLAIMFTNFINFDNREMWDAVDSEVLIFKNISPFIVPNDPNNPLPMDVPKIIFNNGTSQLAISNLRIDLNFQSSDEMRNIKEYTCQLLNIVKKLKILISFRVGIVLTYSLNNEDMLIKIKDLIKFDKISDTKEVQFSYFKNDNKSGLEINNWLRYFYTPLLQESTYVIDVNNSANTPFLINSNNIDDFFIVAEDILNESKR